MKVWCRTCKHNPICKFAQNAIRIFSDEELCDASEKFEYVTRGTPISIMPYCEEYEEGEIDMILTCGDLEEEVLSKRPWEK